MFNPYNLIINNNATILSALKKLENNKKGFLIILRDNVVVGTLTDGDLRRAFINGKQTTDPISDIYTQNYAALYAHDSFSKAIDLLSSRRVGFLPIVEKDRTLVNIITKKQLQAALLLNLQVDLTFDFQSLDETVLEHEIAGKPWGFYKTTVINDFYQSKVLTLTPRSSISLQRHTYREEHWLVVFGTGEAQIGDSIIPLIAGRFVFIPKNCTHRLRNTAGDTNLVVVEVQLGEDFDENDIERLEDEYERN